MTLSREELPEEVWDHRAGIFTLTVNMHVACLRKKLEQLLRKPQRVLSVSRVEYKFQD